MQILQERDKLVIYNSETRQMLIEMNVAQFETFNLEELRHELSCYQRLEDIVLSKYKQIILSLYKNKPDFFDNVDSRKIPEALIQNDFVRTVDRNLFLSTFDYDIAKCLKQKTLIFWGESMTTHMLVNALQETAKEIIVKGTRKTPNFNYLPPTVYKNFLLEGSEFEAGKVIHIVYENNFTAEQLNLLSQQLKGANSVLYYKAGVNELFIGPLIIGEDTCSFEDYQQQYPSRLGQLSQSVATIAAGVIQRILYFLILDALAYIGEDAQLPLNSVFKMNTYTLALQTKKIFKGISNCDHVI